MADFSHLETLLTGTLILDSEGSKAYENELEGYWNGIVRSCRPRAFILIATVEDVVKSVTFCVQNKVNEMKGSNFLIAPYFNTHAGKCMQSFDVSPPENNEESLNSPSKIIAKTIILINSCIVLATIFFYQRTSCLIQLMHSFFLYVLFLVNF